MDKEKQKKKLVDFFRRERRGLIGYVRRWIDDAADRDGEDIEDAAKIDNLLHHFYITLLLCPKTVNFSVRD